LVFSQAKPTTATTKRERYKDEIYYDMIPIPDARYKISKGEYKCFVLEGVPEKPTW
jgi:hypothetical protein